MAEPNFSESQLQAAVNGAYIRLAGERHRAWIFAHVPSLVEEFDVGWDSAFYFPWLSQPPSARDSGCNFFVQYKLSGELSTRGAKEWSDWCEAYFRFKIPHSTKNVSGQFLDDYHQWDRLKSLANQGYPTFYATNSTLMKDQIIRAYEAGHLLKDIPVLDVRAVVGIHKHVTFTPSSSVFRLHSEGAEVPKRSLEEVVVELREGPQFHLEPSTDELLSNLELLGDDDPRWLEDLARLRARVAATPADLRALSKRRLVIGFLHKHLGCELLWIPNSREEG